MAQLNDLIVNGVARFLNTIHGNIDGTSSNVTGTVAVANGGTGATTAQNARANLSVPYMYTDSYPTLQYYNGTNTWIKIGTSNTSYGLLPSAAGNAGSGHNYLGTSTWYWKYSYIDEMNAVKLNGVTIGSSPKFTDTLYTLSTSGNNIVLNKDGTAQNTITVPYATSAGSATDSTKLPLTGGTLTGDLTLYREGTTANNYPARVLFSLKDTTTGKTYSSAYLAAYQDHQSTPYGVNFVLNGGGGLFIGSGESPAAHYSAKGSTYAGEATFITADDVIHLQSNGNTIANRVGFQITTGGALVPEKADTATTNIGSIGTSSYYVADGYFTNINGVAVGSSPKFTDTTYSAGTGLSLSSGTFSINNSGVSPYEANLQWGGKNFSGSYGCIDAAMVSDLNANRFSFLKAAGITIEYTRNGGTTWTDYGASAEVKSAIFNPGNSLIIGKADSTNKATANGTNYQLRLTINTATAGIYTGLTKIIIYCSTNGSADCKCQILGTKKPSTDYTAITNPIGISGWSGYNVIQVNFTAGNSFDGQYNNVRFLFTANGGNTSYTGLTILQILGFGGVGWGTPSTMAKMGHLYSYDGLQNATFPANLKMNADKQVAYLTATPTTGQVVVTDGTTGGVKSSGYTIATSVPSGAVFTDTNNAVTQTAVGSTYTNWRPLIIGSSNSGTEGFTPSTVTDGTFTTSTISCQPSTGTIKATTFKGNATSASKLGSSTVGGTTTPIYLDSGTPTALSYTIAKSVPANAVFTDTNNAVAQTATTTDATYRVLFSATADNTTRTEGARKSDILTVNPGTATFCVNDTNGIKMASVYPITNGGILDVCKTTSSSSTPTISLNGTTGYVSCNGITSTNDTISASKMIATAFKSSIAVGSMESTATTIPNLINDVKNSNGCCGSVSITTAYEGNPSTVATGWYNFIWIPHRSGGKNGVANGDNTNYGRLLLFGMTVNNEYTIRYSGSAITYCRRFLMNNGDNAIQLYTGSLTKGNQTTISNGYGIYTSYIVVGDLSGSQPYGCVAVPKAMLTTSAARYQYADESNYTSFQMWYSGTTLYVKCDNSSNASGRILKVYGIH